MRFIAQFKGKPRSDADRQMTNPQILRTPSCRKSEGLNINVVIFNITRSLIPHKNFNNEYYAVQTSKEKKGHQMHSYIGKNHTRPLSLRKNLYLSCLKKMLRTRNF
jgi:hypothetical protein